MSAAMPSERFVGRAKELLCLQSAVRFRESLLIWGAAGTGKTELVRALFDRLPESAARGCLYVEEAAAPRELLCQLIVRLREAGDRHVRERAGIPAGDGPALIGWLRRQRFSRLKAIFYPAVKAGEYWIFLDHMRPFTHAMLHVMEAIRRVGKTPVYLLARGYQRKEIGEAARPYWHDKQRLALGPLPVQAARVLVRECMQDHGLSRFHSKDFAAEVLNLSDRLPGALVKMCGLACDPRYRSTDRIKTRLIHLDYLLNERDRDRQTLLQRDSGSSPPANE